MKRTFKFYLLPLLIILSHLGTSCKKEEAPQVDTAAVKKDWITGVWKQKDITLGVSTKVSGLQLTAGSSMLDDPIINMLLGALGGNPFVFTRDNVYSFNADGTYSVSGITEFPGGISPLVAGQSGTWDLEVYTSVLALFPSSDTRDPHWINSIAATKLNLAVLITLPGLGDVPMNLVLEKQ